MKRVYETTFGSFLIEEKNLKLRTASRKLFKKWASPEKLMALIKALQVSGNGVLLDNFLLPLIDIYCLLLEKFFLFHKRTHVHIDIPTHTHTLTLTPTHTHAHTPTHIHTHGTVILQLVTVRYTLRVWVWVAHMLAELLCELNFCHLPRQPQTSRQLGC